MGGVLDWSTTPGSNTVVDGVNIAEGMQAGLVNNGMRAIMALVREWQLDASGVVTAGAGNAYTITSNQGIAAYADGQRFSFRADRNNTGAATLNVDARGAKALRKTSAGALAALAADDIVAEAAYDAIYDVSSDVFVIVGMHGVAGMTAFGQSLISAADAAAGRTVLALGTVATESIVPLAKGGTGVALADPGADRILFWDDSAGAMAFLEPGPGLIVSGTTLTSAIQWQTAVATTSGDNLSLSAAIPATASRLIVSLRGVSLNGGNNILVQLGTSGGIVTAGYVSSCAIAGPSTAGAASTSGILVIAGDAGRTISGSVTLDKVSGNLWSASVCCGDGIENIIGGGGYIGLGGAATQIRISTDGANAFYAGAASVGWQ